MTEATRLVRAVRAAGLAELLWTPGDDAPPAAVGVVPLLLGEQPCVALTWAYEEQARAAAASRDVALVLSEPRLAGPGWTPVAVRGRATLVEDGDGELFRAQLLDQELRKHPPARALAESPLLRREHWWYLPRLVLLLDPAAVAAVGARQGPSDVVLAVAADGLQVQTVQVGDWSATELELHGAPADLTGPAALVGQEVSAPDAERWTVHRTTGRLTQGRLVDVQPAQTRQLEPVPGLLARVRRQRALERACTRALRAAGHG